MSRVSRMGPTSVPPSSWFPRPLRHASFFRFLRPSALGCRLLPLPSALTPALFTPLPTFLCLCPRPSDPPGPRPPWGPGPPDPPRPLLFASPSLPFRLPHSAVRFDPPPPRPRPPHILPSRLPPPRFLPAASPAPCPSAPRPPPLPSSLRPASSAPPSHPSPPVPRSASSAPRRALSALRPRALRPIHPAPSAFRRLAPPLAAVGGGAPRAAAVSPPLRPGVLVIG